MKRQLLRESQVEALRFLSSMTLDLKAIAQSNRLPMVNYFLEMAYIEINDAVRAHHESRGQVNADTKEHLDIAA